MKIQEIAALAGVSTATVSRVFSHHPNIRGEIRAHVFAVARQYGYHPRLNSRQKNVVILLPCKQLYPVPEYAEMVTTELIQTLAEQGFRIELLPQSNLAQLNGIPFCGAISVGMAPPPDWDEKFALPFLLIDLPRPRDAANVFSVRSDEMQGMDLAISHLAERGCQKIGVLIHGVPGLGNAELRKRGVCVSLRRHHLPADERLVHICPQEQFMEEIGKFLRLNADALFCCGGSNVGGIAAYCLSLFGKKIPDDIRMVSSERIRISRYCVPAQTTISQDYVALAQKTVQVLNAAITGSPTDMETVLPYRLIARDST